MAGEYVATSGESRGESVIYLEVPKVLLAEARILRPLHMFETTPALDDTIKCLSCPHVGAHKETNRCVPNQLLQTSPGCLCLQEALSRQVHCVVWLRTEQIMVDVALRLAVANQNEALWASLLLFSTGFSFSSLPDSNLFRDLCRR